MKRKTKQEKEHMRRVAELGCIICSSPAEVHHILEGRYGQRKSSNFDVIPLCPLHHRTGGLGVAIHAGAKTWREIYGSELQLLKIVRGMING